jgi:hypothetical protein
MTRRDELSAVMPFSVWYELDSAAEALLHATPQTMTEAAERLTRAREAARLSVMVGDDATETAR